MRLGTNLGNSLTVRGIGGHRRKSAMSKLRYSDHKQYEAIDQKCHTKYAGQADQPYLALLLGNQQGLRREES